VILDALWGQGQRPELREFLTPWLDRGLDIEDLLAVLCVDQRRRWLSAQRVDVSAYQTRFPILEAPWSSGGISLARTRPTIRAG